MKNRNFKIFLFLLIFLILDLIRPFSYSLCTEFLFLGIVVVSLNYSFWPSLFLSIIFGYIKDSISFPSAHLNLIEFPLVSAFINYTLIHFQKRIAIFLILFAVLIAHIFLNSIYIEELNLWFSSLFFIHSYILFFLINSLLKKWIKTLSVEHI
jgi:cell shape-determining protein MreD